MWLALAAEQVLFCTVTALGLVRLVCQPKLMGAAVKTAGEVSIAILSGLKDWSGWLYQDHRRE